MFAGIVKNRRSPASLWLSAATHAAVIGAVYFALHAGSTHPIYLKSRCCSTALYYSANVGGGSPKSVTTPKKKRATIAPAPSIQPVIASAPVATAQNVQAQTGLVSQQQLPTQGTGEGADDATPALPLFHPHPPIADRSLLPVKEQDVVVDVAISALGDVTDEKLIHGLGNGLDQVVLDTVKGWHFRPATLNGSAVASMEEIVIPLSHDTEATPS
jgi:Gram-negative bacterial TonB protein C-terminal